jgi:exodeoxyribonuclease V alpha subunit
MGEAVKLQGTIRKILYPRVRSVDSDFMIAVLEKNGAETVIKGNIYGVKEKEEITIEGEWVNDKKHGLQIKVTAWERPIPTTKAQAIDLLSSSIIKGCGPKTAKLIVDVLGDGAVEIILRDKEKALSAIKGMGQANAQKIVDSLSENYGVQTIIKHLSQYGVTVKMAIKLHKEYNGNAVGIIKTNPYELTNLSMVGFDKADSIAKNMGVAENSMYRCEAAILHTMKEFDGHCYASTEDLTRECLALLSKRSSITLKDIDIKIALQSLAKRRKVKIDDGKVYLAKVHEQETTTAKRMAELMTAKCPVMPKSRIDQEIMRYQATNKVILNARQREAVHRIFSHNVLVLTGGPGTGKTFCVKAIIDIYKQIYPNHPIALCAPTGRASQNLSTVVGLAGKTAHRLLNWGMKETEDGVEATKDRKERNEHNPLDEKVIIVDEMSMTDIELMCGLVRAIRNGSKVLFAGDADQLPSVGAGAVLRDIINSGVPHVRLTEIYRQAKNSLIIENAHRVNQGQMVYTDPLRKDFLFLDRPNAESTLQTVLACVKRLLELGYSQEDILILSPMKKGVAGTVSTDEAVRLLVNPPHYTKKELIVGSKSFRVGDVIIQNKRNDIDRGLYNGSMGIVKDICKDPSDADSEVGMLCEIWGKEVFLSREDITDYDYTTAYCITTHKSQGGQAKVVIAPVITNHYIMLTRNIVYTAMTRAEEMLIMIGQRKALAMAINNVRPNLRRTFLAERIKAELSAIKKSKGEICFG